MTICWVGYSDKLSLRCVLAAGTQSMNPTQRWLAGVRPRHTSAQNVLIANMRNDPNIPWLNSIAAMH
jgi:hypothetical protein